MIRDLISVFKFFYIQKKYQRIFFFENSFTENHLAPYLDKNICKNKTLILCKYHQNKYFLVNYNKIIIRYNFFLNIIFSFLQIKYCYSTTPELGNNYFVKSPFKKTKYIFIQHSAMGLNVIYNDRAFDNFDLVQTINKFQYNDLLDINRLNKKKIKPWRSKYFFFYNSFSNKEIKRLKLKVLIAPTHGTDFYKKALNDLIYHLDNDLYEIELRPHLVSIKEYNNLSLSIKNKIRVDYGNLDLNSFDILISDWSGIYLEYAFKKKQKPILINTKQKILNKNYSKFQSQSIDTISRKEIAETINISQIEMINSYIQKIQKESNKNKDIIESFFKNNFY
jgi:hypothetical protein